MRLKVANAKTDSGPYLQVNEDFYNIDLTNDLFMVLDGFGGTGAGDMAVKFVVEHMTKFYLKIAQDPESTMPFFFSNRYLIEGNALVNAMLYTHKSLLRQTASQDVSKRGGASGVFLSLADNIATLALVGNVYAYLFRDGRVQEIVLPDNFKPLLGKTQSISQIPTSGFGLFDDLYFQVKEFRPIVGDVLMLATDGAVASLDKEEMSSIIFQGKPDYNTKIDKIFHLANAKGNVDNQSTMILEF